MNGLRTERLYISGLNCPNCAAAIERELSRLPGVTRATVDMTGGHVHFELHSEIPLRELEQKASGIASGIENGVTVSSARRAEEDHGHEHRHADEGRKGYIILVRVAVSLCLMAAGLLLELPLWGEYAVFIAAWLCAGYEFVLQTFKNILKGRVFDENFLMTVATVGALAIGELPEAAGVMLFYQVGEFFQGMAVSKSRRSIASLMRLAPDMASVITDGGVVETLCEDVPVGSVILVRPGDKFPLDGVVLSGESTADTSAMTGEPLPKELFPGEEALAGFVNGAGALHLEVTRPSGETAAAKIMEMLESASKNKASAESFIEKFARVYTPAVVLAALLVAVLPPLFLGGGFYEYFRRALTFLVISCPCALVISVPLSFFGGIGGASKHGILVRGGNYLEALAKAGTVVFDKTGTLTSGEFSVSGVFPEEGISESELLRLAAAAENGSSHPIARSIIGAFEGKAPLAELHEEIPGGGVRAVFEGKALLIGNARLMRENGIEASGGGRHAAVHLASNGRYLGRIELSDTLKNGAPEAVSALRGLGIKKIAMLTGDREEAARDAAERLKLDEYRAELMPADKISELERIMEERGDKRPAVFVGDGINDAPVLARADVAIAFGTGASAASAAADMVIVSGDISKVPLAVRIAKKTALIVRQNVTLAIGLKLLVLLLAALGYAQMWAAIMADVGVALLAVLNALRTLRIK